MIFFIMKKLFLLLFALGFNYKKLNVPGPIVPGLTKLRYIVPCYNEEIQVCFNIYVFGINFNESLFIKSVLSSF